MRIAELQNFSSIESVLANTKNLSIISIMISLAPKIVGETWLDVTLIFLIVLIMMALVPIIFRVMWFSNYKRTLRKKAASYTPPTKSKWKGKTFLCYVNPVGGNRIGRFVLEKVVKPMMESAGINLHVVFTEYPEHARYAILTTFHYVL